MRKLTRFFWSHFTLTFDIDAPDNLHDLEDQQSIVVDSFLATGLRGRGNVSITLDRIEENRMRLAIHFVSMSRIALLVCTLIATATLVAYFSPTAYGNPVLIPVIFMLSHLFFFANVVIFHRKVKHTLEQYLAGFSE